MTTTTPSLASSLGGEQQSPSARLAERIHRLRTRTATGGYDRWLLIVGGLLMPLGVLFILLGWVGVSHTPLPFEQNSYLISGGILGLALVFAGGFVYFAYWQTVRIRESREQTTQLTEALARVEALLTAGGAPGATSARGSAAKAGFVATPNGSIFHRPDCSVVADRDDLSAVNPQRTKLEPCRICTPLDEA
jgi:multisubunit Na+/H+ antiporter MnhG subunit